MRFRRTPRSETIFITISHTVLLRCCVSFSPQNSEIGFAASVDAPIRAPALVVQGDIFSSGDSPIRPLQFLFDRLFYF